MDIITNKHNGQTIELDEFNNYLICDSSLGMSFSANGLKYFIETFTSALQPFHGLLSDLECIIQGDKVDACEILDEVEAELTYYLGQLNLDLDINVLTDGEVGGIFINVQTDY